MVGKVKREIIIIKKIKNEIVNSNGKKYWGVGFRIVLVIVEGRPYDRFYEPMKSCAKVTHLPSQNFITKIMYNQSKWTKSK